MTVEPFEIGLNLAWTICFVSFAIAAVFIALIKRSRTDRYYDPED